MPIYDDEEFWDHFISDDNDDLDEDDLDDDWDDDLEEDSDDSEDDDDLEEEDEVYRPTPIPVAPIQAPEPDDDDGEDVIF